MNILHNIILCHSVYPRMVHLNNLLSSNFDQASCSSFTLFYSVFLSHSKSLPRLFGAVIVSTQPKVQCVAVHGSVKPDPITIAENDVVYWAFNEEKTHDVVQIHNVSQAASPPQCRVTPPR